MRFIYLLYFFAKIFYTIKNQLIKPHNNFSILKASWSQSRLRFKQHWSSVEYLVVDLEMSSLNANSGEILSIGWVVIKRGSISLGSAEHHIIHSNHGVGQSATIHQLRDCDIEQGLSITQISKRFLAKSKNRVLVFHNAALDMAFLNKASKQIYGAPLLSIAIDTLLLEKDKLLRSKGHISQGDLKLTACRERYNLPLYPAHNALMDAIATAELLLAIAEYKGGDTTLLDLC